MLFLFSLSSIQNMLDNYAHKFDLNAFFLLHTNNESEPMSVVGKHAGVS